MFEALRSESKPKSHKNLEAIKMIYEQQAETMQNNFNATRRKLDTTLGELREKNNNLEFELRDVKNHFEKLQLKYQYKLKEEEYNRRDWDIKYREMETEKTERIQILRDEIGKPL